MLKQLLGILGSTAFLVVVSPGLAATKKDAAAQKKIDEALNVDYASGKFDKAERTLRAAMQICTPKACSNEMLGKIHVAEGIVRGKAQRNLGGARKAFEQAKKADPEAKLDPKLVSPPVAQDVVVEFYKVMGRDVPAEYARGTGPVGHLQCVPAPDYEIQTAQPIAVVCDPLEGAVRAELYYRAAGETEYTSLLMSVQDGTFRANIPCEPLTKPGELDVYVVAQDFNQEKIDTFGSSAAPAHYKIVNSTSSPPPTYPGQAAPKRCTELLNAGATLGQSCSAAQRCKHGLYCEEGTCHKAPACETDSECESAHCSNGYCDVEPAESDSSPKMKRWMVGVEGGLDLWMAPSSRGVCGVNSQRDGDFFCYNRGESRIYNDTSEKTNRLPMTDTNASGNTVAGLRMATIRVKLSVDRVLSEHWSVGGRLGWALLGGPRAIGFDSADHPSKKGAFIPAHAEARATLWLFSLAKTGLHPSIHVSAGMAQVDANTPINAKLVGNTRKLDAWHRMGPVFAGGGLGLLYDVNAWFAARFDLNAMFMLPETGLVLEPTLGGVLRF